MWTRKGLWSCLFLVAVATAPAAAEPVAEVARVKGGAIVWRAGAGLPLVAGASVDAGDTVKTDGDARLELRFTDGATLTLGSHANMVVAEYLYVPEQGGRGVLEVNDGACSAPLNPGVLAT